MLYGLSPRVRGNPRRLPTLAVYRRSIPACAGEPNQAPAAGQCAEVYPRVCGGTAVAGKLLTHPAGLSPRVRGNRSSHFFWPPD